MSRAFAEVKRANEALATDEFFISNKFKLFYSDFFNYHQTTSYANLLSVTLTQLVRWCRATVSQLVVDRGSISISSQTKDFKNGFHSFSS